MYERSSLAIKAGVLRIGAVDEENPHIIRALVKVHEQYKSDKRYGVWEMLLDVLILDQLLILFLRITPTGQPYQESAGGRQE